MTRLQGKLVVVFISLLFTSFSHGQAQTEPKPVVTLERVALPISGQIEDCLISPDGKRYAVAAKKEDKWLVVVDGTIYGPYDEILGKNPARPRCARPQPKE